MSNPNRRRLRVESGLHDDELRAALVTDPAFVQQLREEGHVHLPDDLEDTGILRGLPDARDGGQVDEYPVSLVSAGDLIARIFRLYAQLETNKDYAVLKSFVSKPEVLEVLESDDPEFPPDVDTIHAPVLRHAATIHARVIFVENYCKDVCKYVDLHDEVIYLHQEAEQVMRCYLKGGDHAKAIESLKELMTSAYWKIKNMHRVLMDGFLVNNLNWVIAVSVIYNSGLPYERALDRATEFINEINMQYGFVPAWWPRRVNVDVQQEQEDQQGIQDLMEELEQPD